MRMAVAQVSSKNVSVIHSMLVSLFKRDKMYLSSPHPPPPPSDEDECTQFPYVCPSDRPVCTNTYGSYKCRAKRRCNQGFEPNDDGSACVGEWSWQSQRLSWITKIRRTKEALPENEMQ